MAIRNVYLSNIVRAENQKNSPEINYYGAACVLLIKSFIFGPKSSCRNLYIYIYIYNGQQREGTSNKHRLFTVGSVAVAMVTCLQVGNLNCLGVLFSSASPYTVTFVSHFNVWKATSKVNIKFTMEQEEWRYSSTLSLVSALNWDGWLRPHSGRFIREWDPISTVQEDGLSPGLVGMSAENLASTGSRPSNHPASNE